MKQAAAPIRPEIAALIEILAEEVVDRILAEQRAEAEQPPVEAAS